jgi:hypothetical protein
MVWLRLWVSVVRQHLVKQNTTMKVLIMHLRPNETFKPLINNLVGLLNHTHRLIH